MAMAGRWRKLLTASIFLCVSIQLPLLSRSLPIDSPAKSPFEVGETVQIQSFASRISDPPPQPIAITREKRAHQAYIRYLRQRKMRQAEERELREKLASKVVPPAATTPGSFLSRLPLPRLPPINAEAIMSRIPPSVLMTVNQTAMGVMQRIPPEVMGAIGAARQAIPAYIEQLRGPVNQAVAGITMMGQQLVGAVQEGYRSAKSGDLMAAVAGRLGMGGPPPPAAAAPGKAASAPKPGAGADPGASPLAQVRRMAMGLMAMAMTPPEPGTDPNMIQMLAQRVMQVINSSPNLQNLMGKVMGTMPAPPGPAPVKKS